MRCSAQTKESCAKNFADHKKKYLAIFETGSKSLRKFNLQHY